MTWAGSFYSFIFWPHWVACGILVPQPGIELAPPALAVKSLNHWTTREVHVGLFLILLGKHKTTRTYLPVPGYFNVFPGSGSHVKRKATGCPDPCVATVLWFLVVNSWGGWCWPVSSGSTQRGHWEDAPGLLWDSSQGSRQPRVESKFPSQCFKWSFQSPSTVGL